MLGQWQHRRAEEKSTLAASIDERLKEPPVLLPGTKVDARAVQFRRVTARGEFAPALGFLLDNKVLKGAAGFHVVTPLHLAGSDLYVLVDRGWIGSGGRRDVLPAVSTPPGQVDVEGIATIPSARFLELAPDVTTGPVRQNIVLDRLESELRIPLQPIVIQQTGEGGQGLVRDWERPDTGIDRHVAYSMQWYALAALTLALYVGLNLKRHPGPP
jgi:surfeit locus 1 family protein